jgi:hypothetical protein
VLPAETRATFSRTRNIADVSHAPPKKKKKHKGGLGSGAVDTTQVELTEGRIGWAKARWGWQKAGMDLAKERWALTLARICS